MDIIVSTLLKSIQVPLVIRYNLIEWANKYVKSHITILPPQRRLILAQPFIQLSAVLVSQLSSTTAIWGLLVSGL